MPLSVSNQSYLVARDDCNFADIRDVVRVEATTCGPAPATYTAVAVSVCRVLRQQQYVPFGLEPVWGHVVVALARLAATTIRVRVRHCIMPTVSTGTKTVPRLDHATGKPRVPKSWKEADRSSDCHEWLAAITAEW